MIKNKIEELLKRKIRVIEEDTNRYSICFPMYKTNGGIYNIWFITESTKSYLTDEGTTYAELDKIFDLTEPDVIENLDAILKQYHCSRKGNSLFIECNPHDIYLKLSYLIQAISFMLNMKLFYVTSLGTGYSCGCKEESERTGIFIGCLECEGGNLWGLKDNQGSETVVEE